MIDLHCHILAGIDDGPETMDESVEMARQAVRDGIRTIVATPHTGNGVYVNSWSRIHSRVEEFNRILEERRIPLTIIPGAEEHFRPDMGNGQQPFNMSTINDSGRYVLVEFPFMTVPERAADTLFRMKQHGLTPVLAHPERNAVIQRNIDILHHFVEAGCLTQITAMSLTGELGEPAMDCAYRMVERRLAHVIASDAHSAGSRSPVLSSAVVVAAMLLGSRVEAEAMVVQTPQAIIYGEIVERRHAEIPPKKKWRIFGG